MRKVFWTLLIVGVGFFLVKKSGIGSYASYCWTNVKNVAHNQVPTRVEIDRARHEIANLDQDINGMIRPIAEHKASITRLKKEIAVAQTKLEEFKESILVMTTELEANPGERLRHKLNKDFDSFKRLETNLASRRKILGAKEDSLKATQEQLAKVIAKKREYEERLAQLEADEETLQIARIGSTIHIDTSRATQIEAALQDIERRQDVQRAEIELRTGGAIDDPAPAARSKTPSVDPAAIRAYLEKTDTVNNK